MKDYLKEKITFVSKLSDIITEYQYNVKDIDYEVFEDEEGYLIAEFVVITYKGDGKSIRCCTGNSKSAIYNEIGRFLDTGYYEDLDYYIPIASKFKKINKNNF